MKCHKIPDEAVRRLPFYFRGLLTLWEQGRKSMSSRDLAGLLGVSHWQIRKDFSYFGSFGTPGKGYDTEKLIRQIRKILKLNVVRKAALVGVGNLGLAVLRYPGFRAYGFQIVAAFDNDPGKIGRKIGGITVEDVSRLRALKKRGVNFGIITVPCEAAQQTFDALASAGVKGILSFSPCQKTGLERVKVITIDIAMDLVRLPYYTPANRRKPKSGEQ
jgi:redox-sensing transcriptional repressor